MVYASITVYKKTLFGLRLVAVENPGFADPYTGFLNLKNATDFAEKLCQKHKRRSYFGGEFTYGFTAIITV